MLNLLLRTPPAKTAAPLENRETKTACSFFCSSTFDRLIVAAGVFAGMIVVAVAIAILI